MVEQQHLLDAPKTRIFRWIFFSSSAKQLNEMFFLQSGAFVPQFCSINNKRNKIDFWAVYDFKHFYSAFLRHAGVDLLLFAIGILRIVEPTQSRGCSGSNYWVYSFNRHSLRVFIICETFQIISPWSSQAMSFNMLHDKLTRVQNAVLSFSIIADYLLFKFHSDALHAHINHEGFCAGKFSFIFMKKFPQKLENVLQKFPYGKLFMKSVSKEKKLFFLFLDCFDLLFYGCEAWGMGEMSGDSTHLDDIIVTILIFFAFLRELFCK